MGSGPSQRAEEEERWAVRVWWVVGGGGGGGGGGVVVEAVEEEEVVVVVVVAGRNIFVEPCVVRARRVPGSRWRWREMESPATRPPP